MTKEKKMAAGGGGPEAARRKSAAVCACPYDTIKRRKRQTNPSREVNADAIFHKVAIRVVYALETWLYYAWLAVNGRLLAVPEVAT